MDVPQLVYPFADLKNMGCLQFWAIINRAAINSTYRFFGVFFV